MDKQSGKIGLWIFLAALLIIAAGLVWYFYYYLPAKVPAVEKTGAPIGAGDTTSNIGSDLNAVDLGNPSQDFQSLDKNLNSF